MNRRNTAFPRFNLSFAEIPFQLFAKIIDRFGDEWNRTLKILSKYRGFRDAYHIDFGDYGATPKSVRVVPLITETYEKEAISFRENAMDLAMRRIFLKILI